MKQRIWVIGAGQLGYMMKHAGMPLQLDVIPVDLNNTECIELRADDLVTAEIEYWPANTATTALARHPNFINAPLFSRVADRLTQKQMLDELQIATAPWQVVEKNTTSQALHATLGERVLLKSRRGGYDGRGQHWLHQKNNDVIPSDWLGNAIAEQAIAFEDEVSLIGMRDRQGNCYFYPLALNLHVHGILMASIAPLPRPTDTQRQVLQQQAEQMLGKLLNNLNYTGVMAMECFRVRDKLLVNEIAPRVHNSGHWTQAGASYSQFEAHLRAISGLPLSAPTLHAPSVMINLIGTERNHAWLQIPAAELFWYGKTVREGRKVGHINFCTADSAQLLDSLRQLENYMPKSYGPVFNWIYQKVS